MYFFFILSGFLITYLLLHEKLQYKKINLRNFYLRRVLRIWPLYFLTIIVGFFVYPFLFNDPVTGNFWLYSVFLTNFDHIWNGSVSSGILGVQWSVAIEEQFYVIWPLLFIFIKNGKHLVYWFVAILLLSEIFFFTRNDWNESYYHFFSCIRFLSFGGIMGYLGFYHENNIRHFFQLRINKVTTLFIYIICPIILVTRGKISELLNISISYFEPIILFFCAFVILEQCYSKNSIMKISKFVYLSKLGKISYGLYLTHMIGIYLAFDLCQYLEYESFIATVLFSLLFTFVISHFSYYYFESYFLKLKSYFKPKSV